MIIKRPTIDEMMIEIAEIVAKRSTCPEAHVGAVIATTDGRVLSFGYNGVPKSFPHCDETGCTKDENGHHIYLVHAEVNAIINAAREGVSTKEAILYCTRFPCMKCAASIIQAGIAEVICLSVEPQAKKMLMQAGVRVKNLTTFRTIERI